MYKPAKIKQLYYQKTITTIKTSYKMENQEEKLKKGVEILLKLSEPQLNCFIGSFDLVNDFDNWKEDIKSNFEGSKEDFEILLYTLDFFEKYVKGEIIKESSLYNEENELLTGHDDIKELIEWSVPIESLSNTWIDYPSNFAYFQLLPVDYNRGDDEIVIVFLTYDGEKYFGEHLTGDY